jgi:hypothetical protein
VNPYIDAKMDEAVGGRLPRTEMKQVDRHGNSKIEGYSMSQKMDHTMSALPLQSLLDALIR